MGLTGFQRRRRALEAQEAAAGAPGAVPQGLPADIPALPPLTGDETSVAGTSCAGLGLADLTVKELRAMAEAKGIVLGRELTKKADIVSAMEKALGEA